MDLSFKIDLLKSVPHPKTFRHFCPHFLEVHVYNDAHKENINNFASQMYVNMFTSTSLLSAEELLSRLNWTNCHRMSDHVRKGCVERSQETDGFWVERS